MTINTYNCTNKLNNTEVTIEIKISGLSREDIDKKFINISTGDVITEKKEDEKKEEKPVEENKKEETKENNNDKGKKESKPRISNAGFFFYLACGFLFQIILYMGIGITISEVPVYMIFILWFVFTFFATMLGENIKGLMDTSPCN